LTGTSFLPTLPFLLKILFEVHLYMERITLYAKAEKMLIDTYGKEHNAIPHLRRTAYWLGKLKPDADEAFLIAALTHDVQRALDAPKGGQKPPKPKGGFLDKDIMKHHQERGGEIMEEFLLKEGATPEVAQRVRHLISRHEVGGDADQDFLKDMDSLSFLENNIDFFLAHVDNTAARDEVREKFTWMFERISSDEVKGLAEPFYKTAIDKLNKVHP
jgi:hypothetical protein